METMDTISIGLLKQQLLDNSVDLQLLIGDALITDNKDYIAYLNSLISTVLSNLIIEENYED